MSYRITPSLLLRPFIPLLVARRKPDAIDYLYDDDGTPNKRNRPTLSDFFVTGGISGVSSNSTTTPRNSNEPQWSSEGSGYSSMVGDIAPASGGSVGMSPRGAHGVGGGGDAGGNGGFIDSAWAGVVREREGGGRGLFIYINIYTELCKYWGKCCVAAAAVVIRFLRLSGKLTLDLVCMQFYIFALCFSRCLLLVNPPDYYFVHILVGCSFFRVLLSRFQARASTSSCRLLFLSVPDVVSSHPSSVDRPLIVC